MYGTMIAYCVLYYDAVKDGGGYRFLELYYKVQMVRNRSAGLGCGGRKM